MLLPAGIDHLGDCPFPLHAAILHALRIISYGENLAGEEQPPKRIWMDPPKLAAHFKRIERERKRKYGLDEDDGDGDGDGDGEPPRENMVELIARG